MIALRALTSVLLFLMKFIMSSLDTIMWLAISRSTSLLYLSGDGVAGILLSTLSRGVSSSFFARCVSGSAEVLGRGEPCPAAGADALALPWSKSTLSDGLFETVLLCGVPSRLLALELAASLACDLGTPVAGDDVRERGASREASILAESGLCSPCC